MRNGRVCPLVKLAHGTNETDGGAYSMYPTPRANDGKDLLRRGNAWRVREELPLSLMVRLLPERGTFAKSRDWEVKKKDLATGYLNPNLTEWLMGFPQNWTEPESAL